MTKKKIEVADQSDSSEEDFQPTKKGCIHVNKGVVLATLRKQLLSATANSKDAPSNQQSRATNSVSNGPTRKFNLICKECKISSRQETEDDDLWICLRCGSIACGSPQENDSHITKHFTDPFSDPHVIAINIEKWSVWCHKCSEEIDVSSSKKLQETAEFLKKHHCRDPIPQENTDDKPQNDSSVSQETKKQVAVVTLFPRVKGLVNLGNTCFFNSVMQCLAQTPFLYSLLSESQEGEKFFLPGFPCDDNNPELPPIEGILDPAGPVTKELASTLKEMQAENSSYTVNPSSLLSALSQKAPQLAGTGDQEDAHELLRTMMETVRSEELRRYQAQILEAIGLSKKIDPTTVDQDKKYMAKVYNNLASKLYLRPDHMFQGQLISILQCQECLTVSCSYETFLDISLPVVSLRHPPNLQRKKTMESTTEAPSKHQLKKSRQLSRKGKKAKQSQNLSNHQNEVGGEADAEDDESQGKSVPTSSVDMDKENGENSPDEDDAVSKEEKGDAEKEKCGSNEKLSDSKEPPTVQEVTEKMETLLNSDAESLNGGDGIDACDSPSEAKVSQEDGTASEEDSCSWSTTLAPRNSVCDSPNEPSVSACLKQFTSIELLTGNNKVGCETCTKRAGKASNGKTLCTNFTKQLLISSPPGILTLHLKRFEVCGSQFRKVSKSVKFPLELDLASVCSVKCKNLPTVRKDQSELLYSLYGVVEHHGMLSGGHYVAFIKSQTPPTMDDVRQRFFLSNDNNLKKNFEKTVVEGDEVPKAPPGKWYYASDSYVSEVTEKKVLDSQAYLLFYERIY